MPASVVYDCMDDLASFAFGRRGGRAAERERLLLDRAELVFAGGPTLYERRRAWGSKVLLMPSGVEEAHFAKALRCAPHSLVRALTPPIAGYIGVIDERLDYAIVDALGSKMHVVMVGPFAKIDLNVLPYRSTVHYTGGMAYAELPTLLAGFDVAIMPFALTKATVSCISPTKTPEYLAAGLPVVSTTIADVETLYGEVDAFRRHAGRVLIAACRAALTLPIGRPERAGERLPEGCGWDRPWVERMWNSVVTLHEASSLEKAMRGRPFASSRGMRASDREPLAGWRGIILR